MLILAQSLGGAHNSVCVHVGECMLVYVIDFDCTALKKNMFYMYTFTCVMIYESKYHKTICEMMQISVVLNGQVQNSRRF